MVFGKIIAGVPGVFCIFLTNVSPAEGPETTFRMLYNGATILPKFPFWAVGIFLFSTNPGISMWILIGVQDQMINPRHG